jgi:serine/threonine-protein kinase HipA
MKIGGEDRPDWIIERRWEQFSKDTGIKLKLVRKRCIDMANTLSTISVELAGECEQQDGENDQIKKIVALIEQRKSKINAVFSSNK